MKERLPAVAALPVDVPVPSVVVAIVVVAVVVAEPAGLREPTAVAGTVLAARCGRTPDPARCVGYGAPDTNPDIRPRIKEGPCP